MDSTLSSFIYFFSRDYFYLDSDSTSVFSFFIIAFYLFSWPAGLYFYFYVSNTWGTYVGYSMILFVPYALSLWITRTEENTDLLKPFYVNSVMSFTFVYLLSWVSYSLCKPGHENILLIFYLFNLFLCFVSTLVVFFICWLIISRSSHEEEDDDLDDHDYSTRKVEEEMKQEPGTSLSLFISLFISVTILLSLSFAFYDSYHRSHYGENSLIYDSEDILTASLAGSRPTGEGSGPEGVSVWRVLFPEASAQLEKGAIDKKENPRRKLPKIRHFNEVSLKNLCKEIERLKYDTTNVSINIVGQTSPPPIREKSNQYSSNYELGQARAQQVFLHLTQCSSGSNTPSKVNSNVEWNTMSLVDGSSTFRQEFDNNKIFRDSLVNEIFLGGNVTSNIDPSKSARIVIDSTSRSTELVADVIRTGKKPRQMTLLDYLHFTTYTITTTGYGDIRPASAVAKTMTTAINLLEVLFIAIFFNLFLAFAYEDSDHPDFESD